MPDPTTFETLSYQLADNGVAFITIDVKDRPVNVLTPELHREIGEVAEFLASDENAIGAVIHSGKASFMAGGDLKRIVRYYDMQRTPEEAYTQSRTFSESLRKLETCGKPVAVAVNGTALGGGLELALACHYRVVLDSPKVLLGMPEVTLGLLPAGGGTQRLPRLIGLKKAVSLILSGKRISPAEALELGIADKLAHADYLEAEAEKWVLNGGQAQQPWDRRGFRVPGGANLNDMNIGRLFQQSTARVSADHRRNYPAPIAALRCLFNGTTVRSMDTALKIESREFSALTRNPVARNVIRTMFLNKGKADRPGKEAEDIGDGRIEKIAFFGDAYAGALISADQESAEPGRAELVVVMEDKLGEFSARARDVPSSAIIAVAISNPTANSVVDAMAAGKVPPEQIIGLHFHPPSDKARLAEVVLSDRTSELSLMRVKDLCRRMRKTPTVQKASHALFSDRCKLAYMRQGQQMAADGVKPALIENAAFAAGMPMGPLAMANGNSPGLFTGNQIPDVELVKQRLLCAQALIAVDYWEKGLMDPVDADLTSTLGWGFPSYTGGVMSYIDTLGLTAFIGLCDGLAEDAGEAFRPSEWLRERAREDDRVYPSLA
jgi:3-hydroxyacyl-CoA dehydrogenase/enoyl-CoA hydratase/3-hydroxybutyryl-CoA epimerase